MWLKDCHILRIKQVMMCEVILGKSEQECKRQIIALAAPNLLANASIGISIYFIQVSHANHGGQNVTQQATARFFGKVVFSQRFIRHLFTLLTILRTTLMSLQLMTNLHCAGCLLPLGMCSLKSIVTLHFKGTALIAEPVFNSVVKAWYLPAGWGELGDSDWKSICSFCCIKNYYFLLVKKRPRFLWTT